MFCAKCKFNSFDHLPKCPKCGFDWKESREALQLAWLQSEGHDWLPPSSPKATPDAQDAFIAGINMDFALAPEVSPNRKMDTPHASPKDLRDGSLLNENLSFLVSKNEKPTKNVPGAQNHSSPRTSPLKASEESSQAAPRLASDMPARTPDLSRGENTVSPLFKASPEETSPARSKTAPAPQEQAPPALDEPLILEEILLEDDGPAEDVLAAWEIPDELIPDATEENIPPGGQPDSKLHAKQEKAVLAEEIVYDFNAFEAKTGQQSETDTKNLIEPGKPAGSKKDERP